MALNWLHAMHGLRLGCILVDEMGLGKTVEAISLLAALRDAGGSAPHLVVAPVSVLERYSTSSPGPRPSPLTLSLVPDPTPRPTQVLENWLRELRTWCPAMRAAKYYGPQAHALPLTPNP